MICKFDRLTLLSYRDMLIPIHYLLSGFNCCTLNGYSVMLSLAGCLLMLAGTLLRLTDSMLKLTDSLLRITDCLLTLRLS